MGELGEMGFIGEARAGLMRLPARCDLAHGASKKARKGVWKSTLRSSRDFGPGKPPFPHRVIFGDALAAP